MLIKCSFPRYNGEWGDKTYTYDIDPINGHPQVGDVVSVLAPDDTYIEVVKQVLVREVNCDLNKLTYKGPFKKAWIPPKKEVRQHG